MNFVICIYYEVYSQYRIIVKKIGCGDGELNPNVINAVYNFHYLFIMWRKLTSPHR